MDDLILIKSELFGEVQCDFYRAGADVWMTREQIGRALGYSDPVTAISKIHTRHLKRFESNSTTTRLVGVEGGRNVEREIWIYNRKGIMEICRWSQQSKADAFIDWAWDRIEELLRDGYTTLQPPAPKTNGEMMLMFAQQFVEQERRVAAIEQRQTQQENRVDRITSYLTETPDRAKVERKVREYARMRHNRDVHAAWKEIYAVLKDKQGFDVMQRVENERKRLNEGRVAGGQKPYAEATLKKMVNGMGLLEREGMLSDVLEIISGLSGSEVIQGTLLL